MGWVMLVTSGTARLWLAKVAHAGAGVLEPVVLHAGGQPPLCWIEAWQLRDAVSSNRKDLIRKLCGLAGRIVRVIECAHMLLLGDLHSLHTEKRQHKSITPLAMAQSAASGGADQDDNDPACRARNPLEQ